MGESRSLQLRLRIRQLLHEAIRDGQHETARCCAMALDGHEDYISACMRTLRLRRVYHDRHRATAEATGHRETSHLVRAIPPGERRLD